MKTDDQIKRNVMDELLWEPVLLSSEIGVAVKNGIVTLSGIVNTYDKKLSAEKATKRVAGVKAVALDIQVGISPKYAKSDTEIAEAVLDALKWHTAIQENKIKIKVEDAVVILEGTVEWEFQRSNARHAIENLSGVKSVINLITVKPTKTAQDLEKKISIAFHRSATLDSGKIAVKVIGDKVILNGTVRSLVESDDAKDAAWSAPGVLSVENNLVVVEPEYVF